MSYWTQLPLRVWCSVYTEPYLTKNLVQSARYALMGDWVVEYQGVDVRPNGYTDIKRLYERSYL